MNKLLILFVLGLFLSCTSKSSGYSVGAAPASTARVRTAEPLEMMLDRCIDDLLLRDDVESAYKKYFYQGPPSKDAEAVLDKMSLDSDIQGKVEPRSFAIGWKYAYQPVRFLIGTKPLAEGIAAKKQFEEATSVIETERARAIRASGLSENDFFSMLGGLGSGNSTQKSLEILERIDTDIDKFIAGKTDQRLLARNVAAIKKSKVLTRHVQGQLAFYEASFRPLFRVIVMAVGGKQKIIYLGDSL